MTEYNIKEISGNLIAVILVVRYILGLYSGTFAIPDSLVTLLLGYYFGTQYGSIKSFVAQKLRK